MADSPPAGPPDRIKYLILGCGSTGYNVIDALMKETNQIIVIDHDEKRVEDLRDQKYDAIVREMEDPKVFEGIPAPEVVFVLSNQKDANLAAVKRAAERYPGSYIIARAVDPMSVNLLEHAGADIVIYPQEIVARSAIHNIRKLHSSRQARRLHTMLGEWEGTLAIVTHTNPDPDSISSAMALCAIAREASEGHLACRIFFDGNIGHQENRAFVNLFDIKMERITPEALGQCDYLALVDSSVPGANNGLEKGAPANIIIDHHRNGETAPNADFVDIRPGMGATASILTQYLQELNLPVDTAVATALLYGIKADTRDFSRNTTPQDLYYAAFLLPLTDAELLGRITSPSISQETIDVLGNAIRNRKIRSGYLFSNVGYIRNRDAVPQAADLLINLEGVNTAVVYGIGDHRITISARNRDIRLHIGNVMAEAFGEIGDAGGHATMAAAVIPLSYFSMVRNKDDLLSLVIEPILHRFMEIVGLEDEENNEV